MGGAATAAGQSHTAMNRGEPCEKQAFTCHSVREGRTAVVMEGLGSTLYMTFKEESWARGFSMKVNLIFLCARVSHWEQAGMSVTYCETSPANGRLN